jgi:hypothetical protein
MLKVIHSGNAMPMSLPVDPTAEFQPGMFAQLKLIGNDIVAGVSDGTAPLGIIDDVRTTSFTKAQIDEIIQISVSDNNIAIDENGSRVNISDVNSPLEHPHIIQSSFTSSVSVFLNYVNGIISVPAGTPLNYDYDGDGAFDGYKIVVNYIYRVATKPGDDSTISSGRVTIHYQRGIYASDQFDTTQVYPLNATLYIGLDGMLTTKQPTENHPGVAICTGPPSATIGSLEFLLL